MATSLFQISLPLLVLDSVRGTRTYPVLISEGTILVYNDQQLNIVRDLAVSTCCITSVLELLSNCNSTLPDVSIPLTLDI